MPAAPTETAGEKVRWFEVARIPETWVWSPDRGGLELRAAAAALANLLLVIFTPLRLLGHPAGPFTLPLVACAVLTVGLSAYFVVSDFRNAARMSFRLGLGERSLFIQRAETYWWQKTPKPNPLTIPLEAIYKVEPGRRGSLTLHVQMSGGPPSRQFRSEGAGAYAYALPPRLGDYGDGAFLRAFSQAPAGGTVQGATVHSAISAAGQQAGFSAGPVLLAPLLVLLGAFAAQAAPVLVWAVVLHWIGVLFPLGAMIAPKPVVPADVGVDFTAYRPKELPQPRGGLIRPDVVAVPATAVRRPSEGWLVYCLCALAGGISVCVGFSLGRESSDLMLLPMFVVFMGTFAWVLAMTAGRLRADRQQVGQDAETIYVWNGSSPWPKRVRFADVRKARFSLAEGWGEVQTATAPGTKPVRFPWSKVDQGTSLPGSIRAASGAPVVAVLMGGKEMPFPFGV